MKDHRSEAGFETRWYKSIVATFAYTEEVRQGGRTILIYEGKSDGTEDNNWLESKAPEPGFETGYYLASFNIGPGEDREKPLFQQRQVYDVTITFHGPHPLNSSLWICGVKHVIQFED